jgi:hypothetical protein
MIMWQFDDVAYFYWMVVVQSNGDTWHILDE